MHRFFPVLSIILAGAAARAESRTTENFVREFDAHFGDIDPADPSCRGDFGADGVAAAKNLEKRLSTQLPLTLIHAKQVPASDRGGAVKTRIDKLGALDRCMKAIQQRVVALERERKNEDQASRDFFKALRTAERSMELLLAGGPIRAAEDITKARADLAVVDEACRGRFAAQAAAEPAGASPMKSPRRWCEAAADADARIAELVVRGPKATIASMAESRRKVAAELAEKKGWGHISLRTAWQDPKALDERLDELKRSFDELAKAAGTTLPADLFQELESATGDFWKEVARVAEAERPTPFDGHNARAEAAARKDIANTGITVRQVGLGRAELQVHKNGAGVPLDRTLPVYMLAQRGKEPYCRELQFTYTESYTGGGNYGSPSVNLEQTRFVSCR